MMDGNTMNKTLNIVVHQFAQSLQLTHDVQKQSQVQLQKL